MKDKNTIYLVLSIILCFWGMLYPNPYHLVIWILILFPILRVLFLSFDKGKFQFRSIDYDKEVIHWSIIFPALALGLRSILDFKIIDFSNGYIPVIFLAIIFLVIYLVTINKVLVIFKKENTWLNFYAVLFISVFSFSIITSTNVLLDDKRLNKSKVVVKSKSRSRGGKGAITYSIKIKHKNRKITNKDVMVSKSKFKQIDVGDTLPIFIGEGKFDIPWIILND